MAHLPGLLYRLEYELVTDSWGITFDAPPAMAVRRPEFELVLDGRRASIEMSVRCPDDGAARRLVEPYLTSWTIQTRLEHDDAPFQFAFREAHVSGRETSTWRPPTTVRVSQLGVEVIYGKPPPLPAYPLPPMDFAADELVLRMWNRWRRYRDDKDGLSAMAYFCLEEVAWVAASAGHPGGRAGAAAWLNISKAVLDRLGHLVNTRGSDLDARHRGAAPYSPQERRWVETVVRTLIRRAGARAAGARLASLTMADLPAG